MTTDFSVTRKKTAQNKNYCHLHILTVLTFEMLKTKCSSNTKLRKILTYKKLPPTLTLVN